MVHSAVFMQYSIYKPMFWPVVAHTPVLLVHGVIKLLESAYLKTQAFPLQFSLFSARLRRNKNCFPI